MFVELLNGECSYTAGQKVEGHICLEVKGESDFDFGNSLSLQFKGMETTEFGSNTKNCGRAEIICQTYQVAEWQDGHSM